MVEKSWHRSERRRPRAVAAHASAGGEARESERSGRSRRTPNVHEPGKAADDSNRSIVQWRNEANYPGGVPMTSFRQIAANRRNASKSTGPTTEEGKQRSRCNAVRHGLTAETSSAHSRMHRRLQSIRNSYHSRFRCPIGSRAGIGAAASESVVAAAPSHHAWKQVCSKSRLTMLTEIRKNGAIILLTRGRLFMRCLEQSYSVGRLTASHLGPQPVETQTAPCLPPRCGQSHKSNSHVVFCIWPICPTSRSIVSAATKSLYGVKPAKSYLLSMHWIVANHKKESTVSISVAGKTCRPMDATTIDPRSYSST